MNKKYVAWFSEVDKGDGALVGGKGANLGEMTQAKIPVPNGFIVTSHSYYEFLDHSNLRSQIKDLLSKLDVSNSKALHTASTKIKHAFLHTEIPTDVAQEILNAYLRLGKMFQPDPYVAIRSSATAEDLPGASFAGQQETFLNIKGDANVVRYVRMAWASLFTERAIFYRAEKKFDHFKVGIAVPVQKMVQSDTSGVMFSIDPVTNSKEVVVIEGIYGLGELIVQGAVTPDHYVVKKSDLRITVKKPAQQETMMTMKDGKTTNRSVPKDKQLRQKITDAQIVSLAKLAKKLEKHYFFPQDIEWAIEDGEIFITQTRPITTIPSKEEAKKTSNNIVAKAIRLPVILTGDPASPGIGVGPVVMVRSAKQIGKVKPGDILVAPQTNPDYVPAMRKVAAIVTERGGRTSHAAIVSRELGIPAVVGAKDALTKLSEKAVITVDGAQGKIYKGGIKISSKFKVQSSKFIADNTQGLVKKLKTATNVYVNLATPERAEEIAARNVDGVGLLRAEFMIADIGIHPKKLIHDHKQSVFVKSLSEKLATFCTAFSPRPIVYRATDFKTNEYRGLTGGKAYEPEEPNPMMGYRGAYRYIADTKVFELELAAIKHVRNKLGLKNLWLMIPYVHTPHELLAVKKIVSAAGLTRSHSFKLWMMVEIPANVIAIDAFLDVGIDGVSIGSNDLTQLTLGVDRDNSEVAHVFDERNPALLWSFERVITACNKKRVTSSMCGQAPSDYPELVEKLVAWGITSVSVNPDMIEQVRETIAHAEEKLVTSRSKKK